MKACALIPTGRGRRVEEAALAMLAGPGWMAGLVPRAGACASPALVGLRRDINPRPHRHYRRQAAWQPRTSQSTAGACRCGRPPARPVARLGRDVGGSGSTWNARLSLTAAGPGLMDIARVRPTPSADNDHARRPAPGSRDDMIEGISCEQL